MSVFGTKMEYMTIDALIRAFEPRKNATHDWGWETGGRKMDWRSEALEGLEKAERGEYRINTRQKSSSRSHGPEKRGGRGRGRGAGGRSWSLRVGECWRACLVGGETMRRVYKE